MRILAPTLCLLTLVGCSDAATPTERAPVVVHSHVAPGSPNDATPKSALTRTGADVAPLMTRLEGMIGPKVDQVALPADDYSNSSDAVHPDIACPGQGWNGRHCWLMYTPYHNGDAHYENPGVLYAADDTSWDTPPNVHNPLIPYPGQAAYNSDPDQAFDKTTNRMVQVYRVVGDGFNKIMLMSTPDAVHWTKPVLAFREPMHDAVSPTLVLEADRTARVWYVQSGALGCDAGSSMVAMRTASPAPDSSYEHAVWSKAVPVSMSIPNYVVWHFDVMPMSGNRGYLALIAAFPHATNCANSDLWLGWSADGLSWTTYAVPILWRTMHAARSRDISTWYRGTMYEDSVSGRLHIWPSALAGGAWTVYHTSVNLQALLDLLQSARPADFQPALLKKTNRVRAVDMP